MYRTEKELKQAIQQWARDEYTASSLGTTTCVWPIENSLTTGTPDLIVCIEGAVAWLELKVGDTGVSPAQFERIAEWNRAQGYAFVIRATKDGIFLHDPHERTHTGYKDIAACMDAVYARSEGLGRWED